MSMENGEIKKEGDEGQKIDDDDDDSSTKYV
jgi:hypothetical protein